METTQLVNHVWMPRDLGGALHEAAAAKLDNYGVPFCKQHLTGKEMLYIQEIFDSDLLNSASKYTSLCAMRIKKLLLGGCPRPTSNPNSPARKDKDNMESTNALTAVKSVYHNESGFDCTEVVITASGTSALEMAAILCEVGPGDEVILPSYTFSSTANAFVLRGATPVFVDIRPDTLNIDESLIEAAITESTKVVCVVHYGGFPCEMDAICDIASVITCWW